MAAPRASRDGEPAAPYPSGQVDAPSAAAEHAPAEQPVSVQPGPATAAAPVADEIQADGETVPARPAAVASPGPSDVTATEVELGAEQVAAREDSDDQEENPIVRATVVDFRFVGYRRLLALLDNGQVWQQIESDRVSVERGLRDEESFEVEMWASRLGGYRMRIVPLDRTIRVERLQ